MSVNAGALDGLLAIVRKEVQETWGKLREVNREAAEFGAQTARSYTRSRPGATTGKAGRVASGAMVNAIRHRQVSFSDDLIKSQYGFIEDYDEYMRFQPVTGFRHNRSSRYIAPTFALRDSIEPTRGFAVDAGRSAV